MALTKVSFSMITGAEVNVLDFGADNTGTTDCTAEIQAAINWASNNDHPVVYFPVGKYLMGTIYTTYDATLNPNFNSTDNGRIKLQGAGKMPGQDVADWTSSVPVIGTVLVSSATSTSAVVLSTTSGEYGNRQQIIQDMTIVGASSTYVIENNAAPDQSGLIDVAVVQTNAAGSGVLWKSSWYTYWKGVVIGTPSAVTSTGYGLVLQSALYAGLWNFVSCSFTGKFQDSVRLSSTAGSSNFNFESCGFEGAVGSGLYVSSEQRVVALNNCYFEGNDTHHIYAGAVVSNFSIIDCQFFGGNAIADGPSSHQIDLEAAISADIANCIFFRPHRTLVYNKYDAGNPSGSNTTVRNCTVDTSGGTYPGGESFYCFDTNSQAGVPLLINNKITQTSVVILINPTYLLGSDIKGSTTRHLSYGFTSVFTRAMDVAFETDYPQITTASVRLYTTTAGSCVVQLPSAGISTAATFYIANVPSSTQSLSVLNDGGGSLTTLAAGEAILCIGDPNSSKWVAIKAAFVV